MSAWWRDTWWRWELEAESPFSESPSWRFEAKNVPPGRMGKAGAARKDSPVGGSGFREIWSSDMQRLVNLEWHHMWGYYKKILVTRYRKGIWPEVFSIMLGKLEVDDIFSLIQIQQSHLRSVWCLTTKNANQPSHVSKNLCKSTNASALQVVNLMDTAASRGIAGITDMEVRGSSEGCSHGREVDSLSGWNTCKKQLVGGLERRGMKEANCRIPNHNDHNVDGTAIQFLAA